MDKTEMNIDNENLPKHIAIIMDGNRRWAKRNGLDTASGHKEGAENLKRISKFANKIGIKYMTVYAFSTENWKRTEAEVTAIMRLLNIYILDLLANKDSNIKIKIIGDMEKLKPELRSSLEKVMDKTKDNTGMTLNIAFNYGGRSEIVNAAKKIALDVASGKIDAELIDEKTFANYMYTKNQPDPDLVIRTSGEERVSNFLLWQIAYSEFIFSKKYWPEFSEDDLLDAIKEYQGRTRNFGGR